MEKNETSGRREVVPSPFCTFLRKNWRSERVALLMPVIKIGGGRVEMGLVCEIDTHTHHCAAGKETSTLLISEFSRTVSLLI